MLTVGTVTFHWLFDKLTLVFLCVRPLIDDELRHNIVKVAVEPQAVGDRFRSKL